MSKESKDVIVRLTVDAEDTGAETLRALFRGMESMAPVLRALELKVVGEVDRIKSDIKYVNLKERL